MADSVDDRIGQVINYIKTILYECRTNKAEKDAYIRTGSAWSGMERSVQMAFCTVLSASVQGLGVEMIRVGSGCK